MSGPFKVIQSHKVYQANYFALYEEQLQLPHGATVLRATVRHVGAVVVLPILPDGKIVMIRQFRFSIGKNILEFPAGTLKAGEPPEVCAGRELIEEAGYRAGRLEHFGILHPAPGFCDEVQHCFLATGLSADRGEMDEDEIITPIALTVAEIETAIRDEEMIDAKSIAVFCRARLKGLV